MKTFTSKQKIQYIVTPKGWLDGRTSPALEDQFSKLITQGANQFMVDCSQVDYISSAGLRVFCHAAEKLEQTDGTVILFGLDAYMLIADDLNEALSQAATLTT
jgi:anti-anti-sigma factor